MRACERCEGSGRIPVGEHFVSREMATDAGDLSLEGESMGVEHATCDACGGTGLRDDENDMVLVHRDRLETCCPNCGVSVGVPCKDKPDAWLVRYQGRSGAWYSVPAPDGQLLWRDQTQLGRFTMDSLNVVELTPVMLGTPIKA